MNFEIIFVIAWVLGGLMSAVFGAALLTYVVRTWQQIRADGDGSSQQQVLDAVDRIETRLAILSDRLESIEQKLLPPVDPEGGL